MCNRLLTSWSPARGRYRVDPARGERVAAQHPPHRQTPPTYQAVPLQRFNRIIAAARAELTAADKQLPDRRLVEPYQNDQQGTQRLGYRRDTHGSTLDRSSTVTIIDARYSRPATASARQAAGQESSRSAARRPRPARRAGLPAPLPARSPDRMSVSRWNDSTAFPRRHRRQPRAQPGPAKPATPPRRGLYTRCRRRSLPGRIDARCGGFNRPARPRPRTPAPPFAPVC